MKYLTLAFALLTLTACATAQAQAQPSGCPPAGYDRASLEALKASEWAVADDAARNGLARALVACVAAPDPALRDGIAFEGLQHWLRSRALTNETMLALSADLEARLMAPEGPGFERPFAALVLSEVVRADRIEAYLTPERRGALLDSAIRYFASVRDYRGYDETEGWRHGVAHGADLLLQLSLSPAFAKPELERIRDAIATQVAPAEAHFYVYREPERMARPIIFMAQRALISEAEWTAWFAQFAGPVEFRTEAGLARAHNIKAFLENILVSVRLTESTADDVLIPGATAAYAGH